jgi:hypothetical protein
VLWPSGLEDWVEMEFFSKPREEVGVTGLVMGLEVGESLCSFDRIFFRNPSAGIERGPGGEVAGRYCRGCARRTAHRRDNSALPAGEGGRRFGSRREREAEEEEGQRRKE